MMLSSISASAKGVANHSIYSGSKGAVEAFARCLAVGESSTSLLLCLVLHTSVFRISLEADVAHLTRRLRPQRHHSQRHRSWRHQDGHVRRGGKEVHSERGFHDR